MTQHSTPRDGSKARVVYTMPTSDAVRIERDLRYGVIEGNALAIDVYYPPRADSEATTPAVVFVTGFSDAGARRMFGCELKEMGSYVSWARLVAASGLVAVTYTNRDPATDVHAVLEHVRRHAASLGIDEDRIGLWSCSGNVPTALSVLMRSDLSDRVRCAALLYGFMLDANGGTAVADAAGQFGFANPCAGRSIEDLPGDIPLFLARAGRDQMPRLNDVLDQFVGMGLARNFPITVVNHAEGPHAFDIYHDSQASREIVRQVLAFFRFNLLF